MVVPSNASSALRGLLTPSSRVIGPDDCLWRNVTERYQNFDPPHVEFVVQPGTEGDVAKIVKYANEHGVEFLLVNRAHSLSSSTSKFDGITIDVGLLQQIHINEDKSTVRLQAGTYGSLVIEELWKSGYVTTTGNAPHVGMVGPALGGGHGFLQGSLGLMTDNIVSMNVVLADGTQVKVSDTSYPDLWWAMRGAGHNFGVVTSYEAKIYPRTVDTYFYKIYLFKGEALESLFKCANNLHGDGTMSDKILGGFAVYAMNPAVSTTQVAITWMMFYAGSKEDAQGFLEPFDSLGPVSSIEGDVPLPGIAEVAFGGVDSPALALNKTHIVSTAGLRQFNVNAQRKIYDLFNYKVTQNPEFAESSIMHEMYSVQGVTRIDSASSAFPLRNDLVLTYFDCSPPPGSSSAVIKAAQDWAQETVDLWNAGEPHRKPTTYVNYATGRESLESMYGYEPWRLEKLRGLKARYDPENRFAYYNPIIAPKAAMR